MPAESGRREKRGAADSEGARGGWARTLAGVGRRGRGRRASADPPERRGKRGWTRARVLRKARGEVEASPAPHCSPESPPLSFSRLPPSRIPGSQSGLARPFSLGPPRLRPRRLQGPGFPSSTRLKIVAGEGEAAADNLAHDEPGEDLTAKGQVGGHLADGHLAVLAQTGLGSAGLGLHSRDRRGGAAKNKQRQKKS